jgi:acyl-CoA reductase-like NAD-dependent aldehyde dehydrogenase
VPSSASPPASPAPKTLKLFTGAFVRSESGRTAPLVTTSGRRFAVSVASRKDVRDMVRTAVAAQRRWADATPYLRGQVLYRVAEMLAGRADEFDAIAADTGAPAGAPGASAAADLVVSYAGWSDKMGLVLGGIPPVPGFSVTTTPVAAGPSGHWCPSGVSLADVVHAVAAPLAAGNAVVVLADPSAALLLATFAEVLATADVPSGTVALAPGSSEAVATLAGATDIRCLDVTAHPDRASLESAAAESLTRCAPALASTADPATQLRRLRTQVDYQTTWQPAAP